MKAKMGEGYKFVNEENENELDTMRVFGLVLIVAWVFLIFVGGQNVFAHGGRLNAQGCHWDSEKRECHCHREGGKDGPKLIPLVISPDKCDKDKPKPKPDKRSEMDFVAAFCHASARKGQIEKTLPNRMRADCVTEEYAIEGDFAPKWDEAFKQAQHYAIEADRRAGILLILKNENDKVYIKKLCDRIAEKQVSIDVFAIGHGYPEEGESVPCADEKESRSD